MAPLRHRHDPTGPATTGRQRAPGRTSARPAHRSGSRNLYDAVSDLQQTAGNRATVSLITAQREKAASPTPAPTTAPSPAYDHAYRGYWTLVQDLLKINQKVVSGIRTDWIDDLSQGLAELGEPGSAKPEAIAALEQRLVLTRANIDVEVTAAKAEWKSLWSEYQTEHDRLGTETGKEEIEALRLLDLRATQDQDRVFKAYPRLTFDDIAGLQTMLAGKTHIRWATHADEKEYERKHAAEKKAKEAGLPHFTSFRIRTLAGGSISVGPVGGEVTTVELVEVGPKGRTATLTFVAAGLALGFEAGAQGPQSWTDFTAPEPMRLEDFQCPGRVTSVGGHVIYGATYSWLTFIPIVGETVKIASSGHGWGLGGGLETIAGAWLLRSVNE